MDEAVRDIEAALELGHPDVKKLNIRKTTYLKHVSNDVKKIEPVTPRNIPYEVFKTKYSGRGLRAARDVKAGEHVLVDEAYVCMLEVERFDSFCYCCLRKIHNQQMYPCIGCTQVRFCSLACSVNSWARRGHSYECKYIDLIKQRTGNINTVAKMLSLNIHFLNDITDILKSEHCDDDDMDLENGYPTLMKLVDHEEGVDPKNPYSAFMVAFLIERKPEVEAALVTNENKMKVAARLFKHTRQTKWNAMSISHRSLVESDFDPDIKVLREDLIGIGLFFRQLLINHSCDPNIRTAKFSGNKAYLQAIKDIGKGDEILNSYGMFSKWQSYQERSSYLKENYCFDCQCSACSVKEEPLIRAYLCKACKGAVVSSICLSCGLKVTQEEISDIKGQMIATNQTISYALKLLTRYLEASDDDNKKLAMIEKMLLESYDKLKKVLYPDHRDVIMTLDSICSFYIRTEFRARSEVAMKMTLDLLADTHRVFNEEVHLFNTYVKAIECFKLFSSVDNLESKAMMESMIKEATSLLDFIMPADAQEHLYYKQYFHQRS